MTPSAIRRRFWDVLCGAVPIEQVTAEDKESWGDLVTFFEEASLLAEQPDSIEAAIRAVGAPQSRGASNDQGQ